MGFKARKRDWIIWLKNNKDSQDDEPVRVSANTAQEAEEQVSSWLHRFTVGGVYTPADFHRQYPGWRGLV